MNLCFFNEKKLFILLRLFITNKDDGPKLNDIISFLSYEFLIYRIKKMNNLLSYYVKNL